MRCKGSLASIVAIAILNMHELRLVTFKLVRGYPNSQYTTDATKRLVFLKDRLAKYEYSVAEYYTERGAWVAVVNRVEGMLRDYPDTQATRDALPLMENAYRQMQMNAQAEKVAKIIAANSSNT